MTREESYLGDGLYAMDDGIQIGLRAPRDGGDHLVYLDGETYAALRRFAKKHGFEGESSPRPQVSFGSPNQEEIAEKVLLLLRDEAEEWNETTSPSVSTEQEELIRKAVDRTLYVLTGRS